MQLEKTRYEIFVVTPLLHRTKLIPLKAKHLVISQPAFTQSKSTMKAPEKREIFKINALNTSERLGWIAGQVSLQVSALQEILNAKYLLPQVIAELLLLSFTRITYQKVEFKIDRAYGHDVASIVMLKIVLQQYATNRKIKDLKIKEHALSQYTSSTLFSTFAKFSEKNNISSLLIRRHHVCVSGGKKCLFLGKFCQRTKLVIPQMMNNFKISNKFHYDISVTKYKIL